jgi:hypothetical protein
LTRLRQSTSVPWRRVGGDILLAPPGQVGFDHLSGTAAVVWLVLETPSTRDELLNTLAELYSIRPDDIAGDVDALLEDLHKRGVILETP